jgi:hypothetical protein
MIRCQKVVHVGADPSAIEYNGAFMLKLWRSLGGFLAQGPRDSEALLRFRFYTIFVALANPLMLGFGSVNFINGRYILAGLILASWLGLMAGWMRLRAGRDDLLVYRINALIFGLLILSMILIGGDGGSKSLWVYVYPLIIIFLFGVTEGSIWTFALLSTIAGIFWLQLPALAVYPYPEAFKIRLVSMYLVVMVITGGFEYSRRRYRDAMWREREKLERETLLLNQEVQERLRTEREKETLIRDLQESLTQVRTLKGLVPICAHCHRIRDDQGFWNQLEIYLREHSDAQFSHGICPACVQAHYSGLGLDPAQPGGGSS